MTPGSFDRLIRKMADSTSRRQMIKTIVASALGGALAFSGLGTTLAVSCQSFKATCAHNSDCCSQKCSSGHCDCSGYMVACNSDKDCCNGVLPCVKGKCQHH